MWASVGSEAEAGGRAGFAHFIRRRTRRKGILLLLFTLYDCSAGREDGGSQQVGITKPKVELWRHCRIVQLPFSSECVSACLLPEDKAVFCQALKYQEEGENTSPLMR